MSAGPSQVAASSPNAAAASSGPLVKPEFLRLSVADQKPESVMVQSKRGKTDHEEEGAESRRRMQQQSRTRVALHAAHRAASRHIPLSHYRRSPAGSTCLTTLACSKSGYLHLASPQLLSDTVVSGRRQWPFEHRGAAPAKAVEDTWREMR